MPEEKKELRELNDEKLDKVSGGGDWGEEMSAYLPADHGPHIGKYDAGNYIGQKFYIVSDQDRQIFYWGTLLKSYEADNWLTFTTRTHNIHVDGKSDYWRGDPCYVGKNIDFNGDSYTLFLMH